jgi:GWxTD domain-containing protein
MELKGEWGFSSDKIPTKGFRVREIGDGITLKISGLIKNESYTLAVILDADELVDTLFFSEKIDGFDEYFNQSIFIPSEKLNNIKNNFNIILKQGKNVIEENVNFSIYKAGFSSSIKDIDIALNQMKYMLDNNQLLLIRSYNKAEKENFFNQTWKAKDPTPSTEYNELMEEYFNRVSYTIEHFDGWEAGWKTDRGMVYILFGAPDEINSFNSNNNLNKIRQVWVYRKIGKEFSFIDQNGFGDYRLDSPFSLF